MQDKSYEAERACGLTFQFSVRHVDACETRAAREGIKRHCGPEQSKYRQRCQGVQVSDGLGGQVQLRDFGRMASGNSRILVLLRSRVVKLTKALKPEKSAEKGASVGTGVRYSNICIDRLGHHFKCSCFRD